MEANKSSRGTRKKPQQSKSKSKTKPTSSGKDVEKLVLDPDKALQILVGDSVPEHKRDQISRYMQRLLQYAQYRTIKILLASNAALAIALIIAAFIGIRNTQLVAIDHAGQLVGVKTATSAEYTNSQIANFATNTALEVFDFNFVNWERRLEAVTNSRFTTEGKRQLKLAMQALLQDVRSMKGQIYIETLGPAQLIAKTQNRWRTRQNVRITLKPADGKPITNSKALTLTIDRVDNLGDLKGLAVSQTVLSGVVQQ